MTSFSRRVGTLAWATAATLIIVSPVRGQTGPAGASVEALQCWRRVDQHMIYVGQSFSMTVTCQVVDTELGRAVPHTVTLEPEALDVSPFEILDGERFEDVVDGPYRFFQYRYTLRLIGEDYFGDDVDIPPVEITYRIERRLESGAALPGRELVYILPREVVRVLSVVPNGMRDIQNLPLATLGDAEQRRFRADLTMMLAVGLAVAAVGVLLVGLVRTRHQRTSMADAIRPAIPVAAVVRAALDELTSVQTASRTTGWTSELVGRALVALRLSAAVALGSTVSERDAGPGETPREGEVRLRIGRLRPRTAMVSAAVTPRDIPAPELGPLRTVLSDLTASRYAAGAQTPSQTLTSALERGIALTRPLRVSTSPPARRYDALTAALRRWWNRT